MFTLNEITNATLLINTFKLCETNTLIQIMHTKSLYLHIRKFAEMEYLRRIEQLNKEIRRLKNDY